MSERDQIRDYFSKSAKSFDHLYSEEEMAPLMRFVNRTFRSDIYERFVLSLEHVLQVKAASVLDIGCGSGRYIAAMAAQGVGRIVGVDVSPNMIELSREHTKSAVASGASVELVCRTFEEFHSEERFDVVMAMGFFDYVKDAAPVVTRMKAFANRSVIASFPSKSFYRTPVRKVRYMLKNCPVYFYDESTLHGLGESLGFARTTVFKIPGAGMDYFVTFEK